MGHSSLLRRLAFALFWPLLAAWTWKLVEPNPFPETGAALGPWAFLAAKTLHATAYATLAALGRTWAPPRGRLPVLALLLLHGVGTEIAQTFVPGRTGRVQDVLVDWAGIAVGWTVVRTLVLHRLTPHPIIPTGHDG